MDGSIRVSAKTVDDAITEALVQLGVTSDQLEYEVIEKGSAGFLGIGMKQAVIEARRKKVSAVKTGTKAGKSVTKVEKEEAVKEDVKESVPAKKEDNDADSHTVETQKENKKESSVESNEPAATALEEEKKEPVYVDDETIGHVEKFLKDTLSAMHIEAGLETQREDEGIVIDISGPNMGIVIGKRGQTLDSLQYLANRVANKNRSDYIRVRLDTEGYRKRREDTLRNLARGVAHKVKKTRRTEYLEPMNPYERRIIHSALQNDPYVTTHSEGEEPFRKVVVTMKPRRK